MEVVASSSSMRVTSPGKYLTYAGQMLLKLIWEQEQGSEFRLKFSYTNIHYLQISHLLSFSLILNVCKRILAF